MTWVSREVITVRFNRSIFIGFASLLCKRGWTAFPTKMKASHQCLQDKRRVVLLPRRLGCIRLDCILLEAALS